MFPKLTFLLSIPLALHAGELRSGHAFAEWITSSKTTLGHEPLNTAIRIRVDEGWHIYWIQPGDVGMKTSVECQVPPGWKIDGPKFPTPRRFLTGKLASFGYKDAVLLPITLTPPSTFDASAEFKAKVSWLACNEDACVPGDAELTLRIHPGPITNTAHTAAIMESIRMIPQSAAGRMTLEVADVGSHLQMQLTTANGKYPDFSTFEVFPATPQIIQSSSIIRFARQGESWVATALKSEYAPPSIRELQLILAEDDGTSSWELTWKAK